MKKQKTPYRLMPYGHEALQPSRPVDDSNLSPAVDPFHGPVVPGRRPNLAAGLLATTREVPTLRDLRTDRALQQLGHYATDTTTLLPAIAGPDSQTMVLPTVGGAHASHMVAPDIGHVPRHLARGGHF